MCLAVNLTGNRVAEWRLCVHDAIIDDMLNARHQFDDVGFAVDHLDESICGGISPAPAITQKNIGAAARPHRLKKHPAARPSEAEAPLTQPYQTTQAASATSSHSLEDRSINLPPSASNSVARS